MGKYIPLLVAIAAGSFPLAQADEGLRATSENSGVIYISDQNIDLDDYICLDRMSCSPGTLVDGYWERDVSELEADRRYHVEVINYVFGTGWSVSNDFYVTFDPAMTWGGSVSAPDTPTDTDTDTGSDSDSEAPGDIYIIRHKPTGKVLSSCGPADGTEVVIAEDTDSCVQWQVIDNGNFFHLKSISADGYIRPRGRSNEVPIKVHPTSWDGRYTQWSFNKTDDGYGHLVNRETSKLIFSDGESLLQQSKKWTGDFTRWRFELLNIDPVDTDTDSNTDTGSDTDTQTDPGSTFEEFTDASCMDGQYRETLPDLTADIGPIIRDIDSKRDPSAQEIADALMKVLDAGYPYGAFIVRESPDFDRSNNCAYNWSDSGYNWDTSWGLAIHECGHALDAYYNGGNTYYMAQDYELPEPRRDYFWRQEISGDRFHNDVPDAAANDTYFNVGSTTGAQGIRSMYDEWAQYNHSVALDYLLYPHPEARSDFHVQYMLNFAWAAPRYLLWAKENHPQDFEHMLNNKAVRDATLAMWGQTFLYYDALERDTVWQPSTTETQYLDAIRKPELLSVMNEVRKAHGCEVN